MKSVSKKPYRPSSEDLARMRRYRRISTAKKLEWLEQIRAFLIAVWKQNPQLRKQRARINAAWRA